MWAYSLDRPPSFPASHTRTSQKSVSRSLSHWTSVKWKLVLPNSMVALLKVYTFRKVIGKSIVSEQFKKINNRYKRVRYNSEKRTDRIPIIVSGYALLFNCTTMDQASDSFSYTLAVCVIFTINPHQHFMTVVLVWFVCYLCWYNDRSGEPLCEPNDFVH